MRAALWSDTAPVAPERPVLEADLSCDVVIVGAGVTGLSTAILCAQRGQDVVVLEGERVAGGVTTYTSAKVSVLHGLAYSELEGSHGADGARAYATANTAGLERVLSWIDEFGIDCSLRRREAYTYVRSERYVPDVTREVDAARAAGIDARLVTETSLPYPIAAAIAVPDQAEFDSRSYGLGLADAAEALGVRIFEHTRVETLSKVGPPSVGTKDGHTVSAEHVVLASHVPIFDRGLFFARLGAKRSYAIAARGATSAPEGTFLSADQPSRSVRTHVGVDGEPVLVVGGAGHTAGTERDTIGRYEALEAFARTEFGATEITHRWSAQDLMPADGMPYVGPLLPTSDRVLVATGYRKWGFTNGTVAAEVLAAGIAGEEHPWAQHVDPGRIPPARTVPTFAKENAQTAVYMVGDWVRTPRAPVCTHLGCKLRFNDGERSWDCPCHGSRFSSDDGRVLEGPATRALTAHAARPPEAR